MQPSSTFCRAQEAHQHALAARATLANARGIAALAAIAWAKEAHAAEKREERKARAHASVGAERPLAAPMADERSFSENPDRGFADAELALG